MILIQHLAQLLMLMQDEGVSNPMDRQHRYSVCSTFIVSVLYEADCSELGHFVHACEGEMFCESDNPKIPYFNAPIYLENKVRNIEEGITLSTSLRFVDFHRKS